MIEATLSLSQEKKQSINMRSIFEVASRAQAEWAKLTVKERAKMILKLREHLVKNVDRVAEVIHAENGKPLVEALICELLPSIELLTYYAALAPKKLKDRSIPIRNPFMRYRKSELNYWPLGTVAVIAPWNYPFFLAFGDIVVGVLTGNAVIFKPSEYSERVGAEIQKLFDEVGFPKGILQTVFGAGDVGSAIIAEKPAKIFFTGSVRTGKAIMKQASDHLTPVTLELGGKGRHDRFARR